MTMQVPMQVVAPPSGGFEGSPDSGSRIVDWLRRNLFSSISNMLLTLLVVAAFALIVPPVFNWAIAHATISGSDRSACTGDGACWTFIGIVTLPREERERTCKRYEFLCGRDDVAPRAHRGGAEHAV